MAEYKTAAEVAAKLQINKLPDSDNPDFAPVFGRLVDPENVLFITDRSVSMGDRLTAGIEMLGHVNAIYKLYVQAFLRDERYAEEVVELLGFLLVLSKSETMVCDEFIESLDKTDPTYATRMVGIAQMRFGLSQTLLGAIQTLSEADNYTLTDRKKLGAIVADAFGTITARIDSDVTDALSILYRQTAANHPNLDLPLLSNR